MGLTRAIDPATLAALAGPFNAVLLAHIDWPDAPVHAHTGVGNISWDGQTWTGVGPLGDVDIPAEALAGIVTSEAILTLAGVPADLDGLIDDVIRNRAVDLWFAVVAGRPGGHDGAQATGDGNTIIGTPAWLFSGTIGGLDLDDTAVDGGVEHSARITVGTGPGARSMASISHSDEDQRRHYPSDTAGRHVIMAQARAQKLTWPAN